MNSVPREGNLHLATLGRDRVTVRREHVDQVVVNHGTRPPDDINFELEPGSRNAGAVDDGAFVASRPQESESTPEGRNTLFRNGAAVAGGDTHAAICDA